MYNANFPDRAALPSSGKLLKSTIIAGVSALAILFGALLPAEYAIDPTGIGRVLGLTQMGEIKVLLAKEAAGDAAQSNASADQSETLVAIENRLQRIEERLSGSSNAEPAQAAPVANAPAETEVAVAAPEPAPVVTEPEPEPAPAVTEPVPEETPVATETAAVKTDALEIVLEPGKGAEIKLEMSKDAEVNFSWAIDGGVVNYDTHGDPINPPENFYHGYGKGKGSAGESGTIKAAFDGSHGWFWRNRSESPVKLRLETKGKYKKLKRVS